MSAALLAQIAPVTDVVTPVTDWTVLLPHLILMVGGLLLLTIASLIKPLPSGFYAAYTAVVALAAGITLIPLWNFVADDGPRVTLNGAIGLDAFAVFVIGIICVSVFLTALLADDYLRSEGLDGPELYVLMLLSASGGTVMAAANDLIVLFLGLEILSIAVYVLAALHLRRVQSQEAGLKYFILGAFSSAFFLYGIAFVYGATGSTRLVEIRRFLDTTVLADDAMLLAGFGLLLVGFGFKVAAAPFHSWTPDVYQGSPSPVVAFMASGVKAAGFAALLRVFVTTFGPDVNGLGHQADWQPAVYVLAILTLLVGSILAVAQTDVKRMLAYSSISHAGFILIGVQAASAEGTSAALFYLAAYTFMVVGSFGVVTLVAGQGDADHGLDTYRGLASRRPLLAFAFAIFLLSQAGVPLTTGFYAKFSVISAAVDARSFWLAIVAMLSAVIAAFVYLRIVVAMFLSDPDDDAEPIRVPVAAGAAIAIAFAFTVVFGILPGPIDELARDAVPVLLSF